MAHFNFFLKDNINGKYPVYSDNFELVNFLQDNISDKKSLIHHIDSYGNTTFNGIQSKILLLELSEFKINNFTANQLKTFREVLDTLTRCTEDVHTFVVFQGD